MNPGRKDYEKKIIDEIGKDGFAKLSRGYDLLGDIAIIDFKGSRGDEKKAAKVLMEFNSSIKTVLAKAGAIAGKYRIRKVRYVAGKRNFIAEYKENGCIFKFDVRKTYFSNRLSFERSRILELVHKGENVIVMFSGVGPFAIEIAKRIKDTHVVAIELNRDAYKYMVENIKLNKLANVEAVCGDVKRVSKKYKGFADRILMPLPMSSLEFLDDAYSVAGKSAIVHLYSFSAIDDQFNPVINAVKEHSKKKKYKVNVLDKRVVRPYSAAEQEIVLDYRISK